MDDKNFEDVVRDDVQTEIRKQIYKCMKVYGAEGLEDKLKELYSQMPKLKELFLTEYYKIIRG